MRLVKDFTGSTVQASTETVGSLTVKNTFKGPSNISSFYLTTDVIVLDGLGIPIAYDGVNVSNLGGINDGIWTCQEGGLYRVTTTGSFIFSATAEPFFQWIPITDNGDESPLLMGWEAGPTVPVYSGNLSFILNLKQGASLGTAAFQVSSVLGTPAICPAGQQTLTIEKVSKANVSSFYLTESVPVPQNTPTVVTYDGIYSSELGELSNGEWTCPGSGLYKIATCGAMNLQPGATYSMAILFQSNPLLSVGWSGTGSGFFTSNGASAIIYIAEGDILTVSASQDDVAGGIVIPFYQSFCIERLT